MLVYFHHKIFPLLSELLCIEISLKIPRAEGYQNLKWYFKKLRRVKMSGLTLILEGKSY